MSSSGGRKAKPRRLTVFEAQNPNFMQWVDKIVKERDDEQNQVEEEKSNEKSPSKPEKNSIITPTLIKKRPIGTRHEVSCFRSSEDEKLYKCSKCHVSYDNLKELKEHKNSRGYKNDFYKLKSHKCTKCNDKFCTPEALKNHHLETKSNEYFQCEKCDFTSKKVNSFQNHIHSSGYRKNSSNTCPSCGYKSCTYRDFHNHIANTEKCRKANAEIVSKARKNGQNNDDNADDVEVIKDEEKNSSKPRRSLRRKSTMMMPNTSNSKDSTTYDASIKNLKRNLDSASDANVKRFLIGSLGAKIRAQKLLNSGMKPLKKKKRRNLPPPPPCHICGKQFSRKEYLEIHMNNVHKGLKEEFICKFCDKTYTQFSNLCRHIRRDHKEKRFPTLVDDDKSHPIDENSEDGIESQKELQEDDVQNLAEFQPVLKLRRLENIKYSETKASNENTTIFPEKYLESLDLSRELEKFKNNDDNDNDSIKEEPTEIIPDIFDYNSTPAIIYKSNEDDGNSEEKFNIFEYEYISNEILSSNQGDKGSHEQSDEKQTRKSNKCEFCGYFYEEGQNMKSDRADHLYEHFKEAIEEDYGPKISKSIPNCPFENCTYSCEAESKSTLLKQNQKDLVQMHYAKAHGLLDYLEEMELLKEEKFVRSNIDDDEKDEKISSNQRLRSMKRKFTPSSPSSNLTPSKSQKIREKKGEQNGKKSTKRDKQIKLNKEINKQMMNRYQEMKLNQEIQELRVKNDAVMSENLILIEKLRQSESKYQQLLKLNFPKSSGKTMAKIKREIDEKVKEYSFENSTISPTNNTQRGGVKKKKNFPKIMNPIVLESVRKLVANLSASRPAQGEKAGKFKCSFCKAPNMFVSRVLLMRHIKLSHRIKCPICPNMKLFKNDTKLITHFHLKHKNAERYYCSTCTLVFTDSKLAEKHMENGICVDIDNEDKAKVLGYENTNGIIPDNNKHNKNSSNQNTNSETVSHLTDDDEKDKIIPSEKISKAKCELCGYRYSGENKKASQTHHLMEHFKDDIENHHGAEISTSLPNCPFKNCTYKNTKKQNRRAVVIHCGRVHGLFEKYMLEKIRQNNSITETDDPNQTMSNIISDVPELTFDNLEEDQTMMAINVSDVPTVCQICFICFENQKFLDKHVEAFHENSEEENKDVITEDPTIICPICKIEFEDKTELNDHMDDKHGDSQKFKFYNCGSCQKMFYSKIHLNAHKNVAHFQTKRTISKDMIAELQTLLKCEYPNCKNPNDENGGNFEFETFNAKLKHVEENHKFECSVCPSNSGTAEDLVEHFKKTHLAQENLVEEKLISCLDCGSSFKTNFRFKIHMRKKHPGDQQNYVNIIKRHMNQDVLESIKKSLIAKYPKFEPKVLAVPAGPKNRKLKGISCHDSNCGESFETIENTLEHIKKDHPIQCPLCSPMEMFKSRALVEKHFKENHETFTPYFCKFCTSVSVDEDLILDHMKIEYGVIIVNYNEIKTDAPAKENKQDDISISPEDNSSPQEIDFQIVDQSHISEIIVKDQVLSPEGMTNNENSVTKLADVTPSSPSLLKSATVAVTNLADGKNITDVRNISSDPNNSVIIQLPKLSNYLKSTSDNVISKSLVTTVDNVSFQPLKFVTGAMMTGRITRKLEVTDFKCLICKRKYKNEIFTSVEELIKHVKSSHKNSYKCPLCIEKLQIKHLASVFEDADSFSKHMKNNHKADAICCQYCDCIFTGKGKDCENAQYDHIVKMHGGVESEQSEILPVDTKNVIINVIPNNNPMPVKKKIIQAPNAHADEYKCPHCQLLYANARYFMQHFSRHHKGNVYFCPYCSLVFLDVKKRDIHITRHILKKKTENTTATSVSGDSSKVPQNGAGDLNNSVTIQLSKLPCKDPNCNESFDSVEEYIRHVKIKHPKTKNSEQEMNQLIGLLQPLGQPLSQPKLGENINNTSSNPSDVTTKSTEIIMPPVYECPLCQASFEKSKSLTLHLLISHNNAVVHWCSYCTMVFSHKKLRDVHHKEHLMKTKSANNKVQCPKCPKEYQFITSLQQHSLTVHDLKLHSCGFDFDCTKLFDTLTDREIHRENVHLEINGSNIYEDIFEEEIILRKGKEVKENVGNTKSNNVDSIITKSSQPVILDVNSSDPKFDFRTGSQQTADRKLLDDSGELVYQCSEPNCVAECHSKESLMEHTIQIHEKSIDFCHYCPQVFTHAILRDFHEQQTHTSEVQSNNKEEIIYDSNTIIEVVELEVDSPASVDSEIIMEQPTYIQNVTPSDDTNTTQAEENVNHLWKRIISSEQKQITIETAMKMESNPNATENIIGL